MKRLTLLLLSFLFVMAAFSQNQAVKDQGERLARKIAKSVKDSLDLTGAQMNQLYEINLALHNQKKQMRLSGQSRDSIGRGLQHIENLRDSFYRTIIPAEKFELYRKNRGRLINNN